VPRKSKRDHTPRHVRICHYMMETPAWKSLGAIERAMYLDIASRYAGQGTNNGKIGYSVRAAAKELDIGLATAKRALDKLQERGFIVCMTKGAFSRKNRHASEWRLTEFSSDVSNEFATKEFIRWKPDENKTRYLQRKQTVAVAEAVGICSGSREDSNTALGICSGSKTAHSEGPSVSVAEHI
jgi:DNA-binding transcriptional regulator YhcF (GntR family)